MEDFLKDLPLLDLGAWTITITIFWRWLAFVSKDRDYWRNEAMTLLRDHREVLDDLETTASVLKKGG